MYLLGDNSFTFLPDLEFQIDRGLFCSAEGPSPGMWAGHHIKIR